MAKPRAFSRCLLSIDAPRARDFARSRDYQKRGGGALQISLHDVMVGSTERPVDLIALDDALTSLAATDERASRVVELRFFGGLSIEETAEALKISPETVKRDWNWAKVWNGAGGQWINDGADRIFAHSAS